MHCPISAQIGLMITSHVREFCFSFDWSSDIGCLDPLIPISDQDRISPHNINTKSRRQVMRSKKGIDLRIISRSNTNFSEVTSEELYSRQ